MVTTFAAGTPTVPVSQRARSSDTATKRDVKGAAQRRRRFRRGLRPCGSDTSRPCSPWITAGTRASAAAATASKAPQLREWTMSGRSRRRSRVRRRTAPGSSPARLSSAMTSTSPGRRAASGPATVMATTVCRSSPARAPIRLTRPFSAPPTASEWITWTTCGRASSIAPPTGPLLEDEERPDLRGVIAASGVLGEDGFDGRGGEEPALARPGAEERIARVVAEVAAEPGGEGHPEAHLAPGEDGGGEIGGHRPLEHRLALAPPQLQPARHGGHVLHEHVVEERHAGLEGDEHAGTIHLGEDILRQVGAHVEVLRGGQVVERPTLGGQRPEEPRVDPAVDERSRLRREKPGERRAALVGHHPEVPFHAICGD